MKYKLSDIIRLVGGGAPKTSVAGYWNGEIPWVSVKDFNDDNRYVYSIEKTITEVGLTNSSTKVPKENNIIISVRGTVGELAVIPFPMAFNQSCYGVREKNKKITQIFLYYILKNNILVLGSKTHGSVFDTITRDTFSDSEVEIPNLDEQKRIADTLSVLDDKIENNNKINHNLEQMAQAIFKSWFIDFEPFGGVMPSDWRKGILNEVCSFNTERINISDLTLDTYVSTENMCPNKNGVNRATTLPTIPQTTAFISEDILISNIRPYFKKIVFCNFSGGCSTDVLCFRPKKKDLAHYVFNVLYCDNFFDYMVAGSKGTKMPRGDKQQIMNYHITIPSAQVLVDFNAIVAPLTKEHFLFSQETKRLSELRDSLLPRLMSGELDVSKIEDYAAKL